MKINPVRVCARALVMMLFSKISLSIQIHKMCLNGKKRRRKFKYKQAKSIETDLLLQSINSRTSIERAEAVEK